MIGLALVVAVNSLGSSFLKTISDEFDRSFARDLTVQPTGFAPGQGPQQTIARSLRDRLVKIPEAAVVARERFIFTSNLPGPEGEDDRGRAAVRLPAGPLREGGHDRRRRGAARGGLPPDRGGRGVRGQGLRGGEGPRGRGHAEARGPVRHAAGPRRRAGRDGRLRRPDGWDVAGDDGEGLRRQRRLRAGAQGDLRGRAPGAAPQGRADRARRTTRTSPCSRTRS